MERIKFITDSACDIPVEIANGYDIDIVPLTVTVDGATYREAYDLTPEEFYKLCDSCKELPKSAGASIDGYIRRFEAAWQEGYDQVCVVCINSQGSVTYSSACHARDAFFEEHPDARPRLGIEIVDSRTYSIAYGLPVLAASRMHRAGAKLSEILTYMADWFDRVEIYFAPLTFDFVKRSGRVSGTAAFVGEALGIRPIVSIIEGKTHTAATVRGDSKIIGGFLKIFQERCQKDSPYGILVGTVGEMAREMSQKLEALTGQAPACIYQAGPAITINGGPKLLAFCFLSKEPRGQSGLIEKLQSSVQSAEEAVSGLLKKVHEKLER